MFLPQSDKYHHTIVFETPHGHHFLKTTTTHWQLPPCHYQTTWQLLFALTQPFFVPKLPGLGC